MRRGKQSNVFSALIRRETNCPRTNDHNLLLSYAEDSSVMSCYRSEECELPGSPRSTFLVCFSPDKTKMASSHGDHTVRIVDCKTFKCVKTLKGHPRTPWCITFHPSSDQLLASGCLSGQVRVWNLETGDSEVYTPPDKAVIASLAFHPTDHVLLIATSNKLLFWSWDQPEPFAYIQTASVEEKVRLVAFSPLGDHILTAVTNIVSQTAANPRTCSPSRSPVVDRLLQSVGNSRIPGGDQFSAYVLRPSAASNNSASSSSTSTNSDPIPETTSSASLNSPGSTEDSNLEPDTLGEEAIANSGSNQTDVTQADVTDNGNQDYRGVFAIFRARDNNTWNFDVTSDAPPSTVLEQETNADSVNFDSDSSNEGDGVSMSLSTADTDVYSDVGEATVNSDSMEQSVPFEAIPPSEEASDRVVGVGRVINVGPSSSRTSFLSHGSNHSSSFATLGGSPGYGTAVATATARTFRHVHTAVVVADGTNGGPQFALRSAINRAIAGAFAGCGEGAVASNIINTTHRLQWWDFSQVKLPDLKNSESNVIASSCKIHNDASCDISSDGRLLATFVPSAQGFPDDGVVAVYSLEKTTLGHCVFSKKFGPNAISISLSPRNRYIMVGLAARRLHWHLTSRQQVAARVSSKVDVYIYGDVVCTLPDRDSNRTKYTTLLSHKMVAQIFRLTDKGSSSDKAKPVVSVMHECEADGRSHVSVNAAFFHPLVGNGLVYGTNRGHLHMRQFGPRSAFRYSHLTT